jgi:hypothetical protein
MQTHLGFAITRAKTKNQKSLNFCHRTDGRIKNKVYF